MTGRDFQFPPPSRAREGLAPSRQTRPDLGLRLYGGPLYAALACIAVTIGFLMLRLDAPGWIDRPLIHALNQFAGRWPALDRVDTVIEVFDLPRGGLIFTLAAAAFAVCRTATGRVQLAVGCAAASLAAAASRGMQLLLPHIPRPLFDPALRFTPPIDADQGAMHDWSSFPSDNAAMLFGVTLVVWFADRRIGSLGFMVFLIGAVARVYGGLHSPSDMLGGAALSAAFVFMARSLDLRFVENHLEWFDRYRAVWAAMVFLYAFQGASLFNDLRAIAVLLKKWS
jgi:membrane-associated phospholipid phosphatase